MRRYILRRLLTTIPTLLGITVLIFLAMRVLPGDPVRAMMVGEGAGQTLTEEQIQAVRTSLGLNRPLHEQYLSWLADIARGEFGSSFWRNEPIRVIILRRAPITAEIAILALFIGWLIGLPVGVLTAVRRNSLIDNVVRAITVAFLAVPSFWVGLLMLLFTIMVFLYRPPMTVTNLWEDPAKNLEMVIGPALALGLGISAVLARFSRSAMLEVLGEDYARTARAKGLPGLQVIWPHALKNAMLPVITMSGLTLGSLLGGAVAVESAFGVMGLGTALVRALSERDWMVIQNLVLLYGVIFTVVNLLVDISYGWFDPRIRYE